MIGLGGDTARRLSAFRSHTPADRLHPIFLLPSALFRAYRHPQKEDGERRMDRLRMPNRSPPVTGDGARRQ
jgi:hypothetical protein